MNGSRHEEYWGGKLKMSGVLARFEAPPSLGSTGVPQAACIYLKVMGFKRNCEEAPGIVRILILAREKHTAEIVCREK